MFSTDFRIAALGTFDAHWLNWDVENSFQLLVIIKINRSGCCHFANSLKFHWGTIEFSAHEKQWWLKETKPSSWDFFTDELLDENLERCRRIEHAFLWRYKRESAQYFGLCICTIHVNALVHRNFSNWQILLCTWHHSRQMLHVNCIAQLSPLFLATCWRHIAFWAMSSRLNH